WGGALLLAIGGLGLGVWNQWPEAWLVNHAVSAVSAGPVDVRLYLWGGITPAVIASLLTISLGVTFYLQAKRVRWLANQLDKLWRVSGDILWDGFLVRLFQVAGAVASNFQHGSLRAHVALLAVVLCLTVLGVMWWIEAPLLPVDSLTPVTLPG